MPVQNWKYLLLIISAKITNVALHKLLVPSDRLINNACNPAKVIKNVSGTTKFIQFFVSNKFNYLNFSHEL